MPAVSPSGSIFIVPMTLCVTALFIRSKRSRTLTHPGPSRDLTSMLWLAHATSSKGYLVIVIFALAVKLAPFFARCKSHQTAAMAPEVNKLFKNDF
jgi:hypothetical protein